MKTILCALVITAVWALPVPGADIAVEEATLYKLHPADAPRFLRITYEVGISWYDAAGRLLQTDMDRPADGRWQRGLFMSPHGAVQARIDVRFEDGKTAPGSGLSLTKAYEILDNGLIRVGINGTLGGAIDYLAASSNPDKNYVNRFDAGRLIQKSFWGLPNTYYWPGLAPFDRFPWNPIMAGYWETEKKIYTGALEFTRTNDGKTVYCKCQPLTYGSKSRIDLNPDRTQTFLETWITLEEQSTAFRIESKFTNFETMDHAQWREQELLAVYVTTDLSNLWTYDGTDSWTYGSLTMRRPPFNSDRAPVSQFVRFFASENWAAWTDDSGFGIGAFTPEPQVISGFCFGEQGIGLDDVNPTNEFSIIPRFSIPKNSVRRDTAYVILDNLQNIRDFAYEHETGRVRKKSGVSWEFSEQGNREGWSGGWEGLWDDGRNVIDDSPGVAEGIWTFSTIDSITPWIISPLFLSDAENNAVEIRMAATGSSQAKIFWNRLEDGVYHFADERSRAFDLIPDGSMHTYMIMMDQGQNNARWSGTIRQVMLSGFASGTSQVQVDSVRILLKNGTHKPGSEASIIQAKLK